jgi:C-terminal processing protease CtpA/Prc
MNYGDVLLGINGVDIEGKHLQDVKYIILCKTNTTVQLTFLNKHWFNNQIRKSVKERHHALNIEQVQYQINDILFTAFFPLTTHLLFSLLQ